MGPLLSREGYRPFFLFFPLVTLAAILLWVGALRGGFGAVGPLDHGGLMLWGALGGAALGFLLTAYPRQNEARPPTPRELAAALGLWGAFVLADLASWLGAPTGGLVTALGALLWGGAALWAARIAWTSLHKRWDATTAAVPGALLAAVVGWLTLRLGPDPLVGLRIGLHPFFIGLALSLLDRLFPFFASKVVPGYGGSRWRGFQGPLLALLLARALGLGPAWLTDLGVILWTGRQVVGWQAWRGLRPPILGVLLLAVAWILAGYAVDAWAGELAATHLWTVGGLSTLILGIATRVSRGHGGKPLALGPTGLAAIGMIQLAAVFRAVLPLLAPVPDALRLDVPATLLALAMACWWAGHQKVLR